MGPFFCQQEWSRQLLLSLLGLRLQEKRISIIQLVIIMFEETEDRDPGYPADGREGKVKLQLNLCVLDPGWSIMPRIHNIFSKEYREQDWSEGAGEQETIDGEVLERS